MLRGQDPLAPSEVRPVEERGGEHPIAEDGGGLPHAGLNAGVTLDALRTEAGLTTAKRGS